MSEINEKKRIIIPQSRSKIDASSVILEPRVEHLLTDAMNVIAIEIVRFRQRVDRGNSLTLPEARVLQGYIKALCDLSKENRDRESEHDFSKMPTEKLIELLDRLIKKRGLNEPQG